MKFSEHLRQLEVEHGEHDLFEFTPKPSWHLVQTELFEEHIRQFIFWQATQEVPDIPKPFTQPVHILMFESHSKQF